MSIDLSDDKFGMISKYPDHWEEGDLMSWSPNDAYDVVTCDVAMDGVDGSMDLANNSLHQRALDIIIELKPRVAILKIFKGYAGEYFDVESERICVIKPPGSNPLSDELYVVYYRPTRRSSTANIQARDAVVTQWRRRMQLCANIIGKQDWVPERCRYYVDISGHLINFILVSRSIPFDFGRYVDNVIFNMTNDRERHPDRAIDESGGTGEWHSLTEWLLAIFVAENLMSDIGLRRPITLLTYLRKRFMSVISDERTWERSHNVSVAFPDSVKSANPLSLIL
jgi:hypothetical protein